MKKSVAAAGCLANPNQNLRPVWRPGVQSVPLIVWAPGQMTKVKGWLSQTMSKTISRYLAKDGKG